MVHVGFDHVYVAELAALVGGAKGHIDHVHDAGVAELFEELDLAESSDG